MMIPAEPFIPGEYRIKHVTEIWELRDCAALRREVFCQEQGVFDGDDADAVDANALHIAAIACVAGIAERVVGTVRIHQPDAQAQPGLWLGSRLAVLAHYRGAAWLGSQLIQHAVCTAHARGCTRFLANVQVQNMKLFERLHWLALGPVTVRDRPHVHMQADLAHYPPRLQDELVFFSSLRQAA